MYVFWPMNLHYTVCTCTCMTYTNNHIYHIGSSHLKMVLELWARHGSASTFGWQFSRPSHKLLILLIGKTWQTIKLKVLASYNFDQYFIIKIWNIKSYQPINMPTKPPTPLKSCPSSSGMKNDHREKGMETRNYINLCVT